MEGAEEGGGFGEGCAAAGSSGREGGPSLVARRSASQGGGLTSSFSLSVTAAAYCYLAPITATAVFDTGVCKVHRLASD